LFHQIITRKENYVLGWDNKEKIANLKKELLTIQTSQVTNKKALTAINTLIKGLGTLKEDCFSIYSTYTKYDDIDWQTYANQIQEKEDAKKALEATNDRVKALQEQLSKVRESLTILTETDIKNKNKEIFQLEEVVIKGIIVDLEFNQKLLESIGNKDTSEFELLNLELQKVEFANIKDKQVEFQKTNASKLKELENSNESKERKVFKLISEFKNPPIEITDKFKDWRSDVSRLPDSNNIDLLGEYQSFYQKLIADDLPRFEKKFNEYLQDTILRKIGDFRMFFENWADSIKENIRLLNESLKGIDFKNSPITYIQLISQRRKNQLVDDFRDLLYKAIPNFKEIEATIDGKKNHFYTNIEPLISKLDNEKWRQEVMEVRSWYSYKAEEFYKETNQKFKTYENMGQLSGGEKAQLTYTIVGSAIAYQFGLTKEGLQTNSFRFIAIDEAFKAQDEDKARYLITLCKQLHLQLLVVTPSDNIHIVEDAISFVHFVERKDEKYSWLYDMPIEQFKEERNNFINK
jgi:uncharacterized protein YPO0396